MSEMTDALMRLADSIDATGDGVEGWETSDAHAWAEQVRDAAERDPYAGTPCGRHLGAVARYIAMLEAMDRKHGAELEGLRAERDALRDGIARLGGQTNSWPTEAELSPEMRARLMPEGMEWPRFEDGRYVLVGESWVDMDGSVHKVRGLEVSADGKFDIYDEDDDSETFLPGERVKRPEPPATASQGRRDSVAQDSWERLYGDCDMQARGYCEAHGIDAPRGRDCGPLMRRDLLRRACALAEGPDVVRPGEVV